jgi:organic hydroperoxide reductase OsmC/OhrA
MSAGKIHTYRTSLDWTGNLGAGTASYRAYSRAHELHAPGKPTIPGSSDPSFRGDASRWNPEELLVDALSSCHMLWYLHLAAEAGIVVSAYRDTAEGTMEERADGGGHFTEVILRPVVTIRPDDDEAVALALHHGAHDKCYIATSVNFPVRCEGQVERAK